MRMSILALFGLAGFLCAQETRIETMAETGSNQVTSIDANTSINDNGTVAFTGRVGSTSRVLVSEEPGKARVISFGSSTRSFGGAAINNQFPARVASRDRVSLRWYMRSWDSSRPSSSPSSHLIGRSPTNFDSCSLHCDINDAGVLAFPALVGGSTATVLMAAVPGKAPVRLATYTKTFSMRPQIANDGQVVFRDNLNRIVTWAYPSGAVRVIAGSGWTGTGQAPGISRDGSTVAFVGTVNNKPGVYVTVKTAAGPVTMPAAGGGLTDGLSSFDGFGRVAVQSQAMDAGGSKRLITTWFQATRGQERGLFTSTFTFDGLFASKRTVAPLVLIGRKVGTGKVTGMFVTDGPNAWNQIAVRAALDNSKTAVLRASMYPKWSQGDSRWACDRYGNYPKTCDDACTKKTPNKKCCPQTIKRWGCYMTSLAMLVRGMGVAEGVDKKPVTPANFNAWLRAAVDGYAKGDSGCYQILEASKVYQYTDRQVRYLGTSKAGYGLADIAKDLESGRRVILDVDKHFVLATGVIRSAANTIQTIRIHDPGNRNRITLADPKYNNKFKSARRFERQVGAKAAAWILISARSPIELLVTDRSGKRLGFDPRTNRAWSEIAGGSYGVDVIGEDGGTGTETQVSPKWLMIPEAQADNFQVEVLGTGAGSFSVYASSGDTSGNVATRVLLTGTATKGSRNVFNVSFDPARGAVQKGIVRLGSATPACSGPFLLSAQGGAPTSPNANFALALASAPESTPAVLGFSLQPKLNSLQFLGANLHLDLQQLLFLHYAATDAEGQFRLPLPIPNGLKGVRVVAQAVVADNGACASRKTLASSVGLQITFQ